MTNAEEVFGLIITHPNLPIVPLISSEIYIDDTNMWWTANWGGAKVDEYLVVNEKVYLKSEDSILDVLGYVLSPAQWDSLPDSEEACKPYYDALPWKKSIIVFIVPHG